MKFNAILIGVIYLGLCNLAVANTITVDSQEAKVDQKTWFLCRPESDGGSQLIVAKVTVATEGGAFEIVTSSKLGLGAYDICSTHGGKCALAFTVDTDGKVLSINEYVKRQSCR